MTKSIVWANNLNFTFKSINPSQFLMEDVNLKYREDVDTTTDIETIPVAFPNQSIVLTPPPSVNYNVTVISPLAQFFLNDFSFDSKTYTTIKNVYFVTNENLSSRGIIFGAYTNNTPQPIGTGIFIARDDFGGVDVSPVSSRTTTNDSIVSQLTVGITYPTSGKMHYTGNLIGNDNDAVSCPLAQNYDVTYDVDIKNDFYDFTGELHPVSFNSQQYYYTSNTTENVFKLYRAPVAFFDVEEIDSINATTTKNKYTGVAVKKGGNLVVGFDETWYEYSGSPSNIDVPVNRVTAGLFTGYWLVALFYDSVNDAFYALGDNTNAGEVPNSYNSVQVLKISGDYSTITSLGTMISAAGLNRNAEIIPQSRKLIFSGTSVDSCVDLDTDTIVNTSDTLVLGSVMGDDNLLEGVFKPRADSPIICFAVKTGTNFSTFNTNSVHNLFYVESS